ncbi:MAG: TonB-dependent receptor, partial [Acidobacteria bacterium]|nr:TonB-dependent receptor [Acidobacteriota bacterium]
MKQTIVVLLIPIVVLACAEPMFAQRTTAMFSGVVTDPTGAVLPGADVQLLNEGTGAVVQQVSSEFGEFVFDFLPVGTYTLTISMRGFKKYENRGIPLGGAQIVRRSYALEIGAYEENISVVAEVPLVNAISTEQRISIETLEIKTLPMVNRNITNILSVGSGLTTGRPTSDGMAGTRFRLNGLGGSAMGVTANGSDANGASGSPNISGYGGYNKIDVMSSESVAEVQVVKGVMPAEYGSVMAGMMSVITKSGTNEFHGSVFHRYEGSALSARAATLRRKPNSVWNQFGGSLGGPIIRDKVFFFGAYEGYRQRTTVPLEPTVPTPYFRSILQRYLPYPETKLVLDMYPLPNEPYGETDLLARWVGPGARINDDDHVDAKIDYLIRNGMFSLTFAYGHPTQVRPSSNPLDPQSFKTSAQRANASYSTSWGGGKWTSLTRAGYNRNHADRVDESWYLRDPNKQEQSLGGRRVPIISFPGMTSLRTEWQGRGLKPSWQVDQQFGFFQGKHSWKFGGNLNMPGGGRPGSNNPTANFQTLDDIMNNTLQSVSFETGKYPTTWRMYNFGFFLQDDWAIARKLVLNLGIRYDRYDHFVAKPWNEDQPALVPNFDGLLDPVNFIWGPLRPENNPFSADPLSLSPRFGFAYTLDDRGGFVMRGGFGVNFQGFDPQTYDVNVAKSIYLPNSKSWTRAELAALGLRYPNLYLEDMIEVLRTEFQGRPQIGNRYDPNSKPPYAMNYTLGFQKELTTTLMLETAYVGSRGVKFNMARPYNSPNRITGIRPNRNDISGNYTDSSQQTNYNSWQTSLRQR